jgi:hypothetical protein
VSSRAKARDPLLETPFREASITAGPSLRSG